MAFIEEIPSAEDIKKFDLPHRTDLEFPIELRRPWVADRERDVYLSGVGPTGNQAFDDNIKTAADFYLGRTKFDVIFEREKASLDFNDNPFIIHYPALLKIRVFISPERGMIDVLPEVQRSPDEPHPFLQNRSLNEFIALLKEALIVRKAGFYNRFIKSPIIVSFGF